MGSSNLVNIHLELFHFMFHWIACLILDSYVDFFSKSSLQEYILQNFHAKQMFFIPFWVIMVTSILRKSFLFSWEMLRHSKCNGHRIFFLFFSNDKFRVNSKASLGAETNPGTKSKQQPEHKNWLLTISVQVPDQNKPTRTDWSDKYETQDVCGYLTTLLWNDEFRWQIVILNLLWNPYKHLVFSTKILPPTQL